MLFKMGALCFSNLNSEVLELEQKPTDGKSLGNWSIWRWVHPVNWFPAIGVATKPLSITLTIKMLSPSSSNSYTLLFHVFVPSGSAQYTSIPDKLQDKKL